MSAHKVSAGDGVNWITDAVRLVLKNPWPFALMGLVLAVVAALPVLGALALGIVGPALYGGIAYAAREQDQGREARIEHLLLAFQQSGKIGPFLMLCLPGVIFGLLVVVLLVIVLATAAMGAGVSAMAESPEAFFASLGLGGLILVIVLLPLSFLVFLVTFFAIPDVMFGNNDAIEAMRASVRAGLNNIGAMLVYLLVLCIAVFAATLLLGLISQLLAQLLVSVALVPVFAASMYLAWKQVYGDTFRLPDDVSKDDAGIVA